MDDPRLSFNKKWLRIGKTLGCFLMLPLLLASLCWGIRFYLLVQPAAPFLLNLKWEIDLAVQAMSGQPIKMGWFLVASAQHFRQPLVWD